MCWHRIVSGSTCLSKLQRTTYTRPQHGHGTRASLASTHTWTSWQVVECKPWPQWHGAESSHPSWQWHKGKMPYAMRWLDTQGCNALCGQMIGHGHNVMAHCCTKMGLDAAQCSWSNKADLDMVTDAWHKGAMPCVWEWQAMGAMPWFVVVPRRGLDVTRCYCINKDISNMMADAWQEGKTWHWCGITNS